MKHLSLTAAVAGAALLAGLLSEAAAQDSLPIVPEQRIRFQTTGTERHVGRVQRVEKDTLVVRLDVERDVRSIPLDTIAHLEVRERASAARGAWRWAKRGFVVGAVTGAVSCGVNVERCRESPEMKDYEIILGSALFLGGGVAFLGAIGGAIFPGKRWTTVPLPDRAHLAPTTSGGAAVSISWRF